MIAILTALTIAAQPAPSVVVFNFTALGAAPELAESAARITREQLRARTDLRLFDLDPAARPADCGEDPACIAETSRLEVDRAVSGSVAKLGTGFVLMLSLVDVAGVRALGRTSEIFTEPKELDEAVQGALAGLFEWPGDQEARIDLEKEGELEVAVFQMSPAGVEESLAVAATQKLSEELRRIKGVHVFDEEDVRTMLTAENLRQYLSSDCDTACYDKIAGFLGKDVIVSGQIGAVTSTRAVDYVVMVNVLDRRQTEPKSLRAIETLRGSEMNAVWAVSCLVRKIFGVPSSSTGSIVVAGTDGAEVFVDGERAGTLPMSPLREISDCKHRVRVAKEEFHSWEGDVYVNPGQESAVWADLEASPNPLYEKWWFWSIVGAVVVGTGIGLGVALRQGPNTGDGTVHIP